MPCVCTIAHNCILDPCCSLAVRYPGLPRDTGSDPIMVTRPSQPNQSPTRCLTISLLLLQLRGLDSAPRTGSSARRRHAMRSSRLVCLVIIPMFRSLISAAHWG